jgi:hypothetical protein
MNESERWNPLHDGCVDRTRQTTRWGISCQNMHYVNQEFLFDPECSHIWCGGSQRSPCTHCLESTDELMYESVTKLVHEEEFL